MSLFMHIINRAFIFLFPIIISFQSYSLEIKATIDFNGRKYSVPLPDGYCNISKELKGITKIRELSRHDDKSIPKVIYSPCNVSVLNFLKQKVIIVEFLYFLKYYLQF